MESTLAEKDLGVLINKLKVNPQCVPVAKVANSLQNCIRKSIASRLRELILPFCDDEQREECQENNYLLPRGLIVHFRSRFHSIDF